MIVPFRTSDLAQFNPTISSIADDKELSHLYYEWAKSRFEFIVEREPGDWQKDYVRGRVLDRDASKNHRTRLALRSFGEE